MFFGETAEQQYRRLKKETHKTKEDEAWCNEFEKNRYVEDLAVVRKRAMFDRQYAALARLAHIPLDA